MSLPLTSDFHHRDCRLTGSGLLSFRLGLRQLMCLFSSVWSRSFFFFFLWFSFRCWRGQEDLEWSLPPWLDQVFFLMALMNTLSPGTTAAIGCSSLHFVAQPCAVQWEVNDLSSHYYVNIIKGAQYWGCVHIPKVDTLSGESLGNNSAFRLVYKELVCVTYTFTIQQNEQYFYT